MGYHWQDLLTKGDECKFGGGKSVRDGMAQSGTATRDNPNVLDFVITNVMIIDAKLGIIKADIGIRDGRIVGIGQAGNPDTMDNVTPNMIIGASTEVHNGVHFNCNSWWYRYPYSLYLSSTSTTCDWKRRNHLNWCGTGPADGTHATTCTPGAWYMERMFQAAEALPVNVGFFRQRKLLNFRSATRTKLKRVH